MDELPPDFTVSKFQGNVRAKFSDEYFTEDEVYYLTAYLPDQQIYAVIGKKWVTFKEWTEEQFLEHFERYE